VYSGTGNRAENYENTEEKNMWHEGTIGVPKGNGKYTVVHYWVKAYEEGSQYGIEGGRISKLTLKVEGKVIYNYDRGEDVPPQNEAAEMALAILMHEYN
jgi:hypothetical protein